MFTYPQKILVSLMSFVAISFSSQLYSAITLVDEDKPMPNLGLLQDMDGNDQLLEDYLTTDKWSVVMFWTSTCEVSNQYIEQYNQRLANPANTNIQVLGISLDGSDNKPAASRFISQHGLSFTNLIGEYENVSLFYRLLTGDEELLTPTFLLISPDGVLQARQQGAVPAEMIIDFIDGESASVANH